MAGDILTENSPIRLRERRNIEEQLNDFILGNRSSVALVGEKGSGKSFLIDTIMSNEKLLSKITFLPINGSEVSNSMHFMKDLSVQLGYSPPAYKDWETYANELFKYMKMTPDKYIIVIDDVHCLASRENEKLLSYLRGQYQEIENILLLFTIEAEYEDSILAYEKPFYGQLYKIELMPLKEPENIQFIRWLVPDLENKLIDSIIHYAGGNLFFLKTLTYLSAGASTILFSSGKKIEEVNRNYLDFSLISTLSPQLKAILRVMANSGTDITVTNIAEKLSTKTGAITSQLKRLEKKGFIEKFDTRYLLKENIKLFFEYKT